eukprot:GILI01013024.1.p1 GENE.GILI01013024.1~~GILI01013024.1.p1  ORF type:complete len:864 (-),score=300.12 GILI01013024.1:45-2513(-)
MIRCRKFAQYSEDTAPKIYLTNSSKEQKVLDHVDEFHKQFSRVYNSKVELLLTPKNECGVRKFICSTIRPCQLPYLELYDYKKAAKFIADFMNYEPLEPPTMFPPVIPSPHSVLQWQAGDCFDLSILLVSLLVGAGYDAYCVAGKAPKYITTKEQSRMECPHLNPEIDTGRLPVKNAPPKQEFVIPTRPPLVSQYLEKLKSEEQKKQEELQRQKDEAEEQEDAEWEPFDPLEGNRVHCWVLIKPGKREVTDPLFIEASTGWVYPQSAASMPYLHIDFVWNHANFWVNMQDGVAVSNLSLDLGNVTNWEYVMVDGTQYKPAADDDSATGIAEEVDEEDITGEAVSDEKTVEGENVLDLAPPWSLKPFLDRDAFQRRCPAGERTTLYRKAKVDQYAELGQVDGLILRVTLYKDSRRTVPKEVREYFSRRKDKMVRRFRWPLDGIVVEEFSEGRPSHLKKITEVQGQRRELIFYGSRLDGLVRREDIIGHKIIEEFETRDDYLIYRSATLEPLRGVPKQTITSGGKEYGIRKMTQKFARNPFKEAAKDAAKVVFYSSEGTITIYYHYDDHHVTAPMSRFSKDGSNALVRAVDPFASEPDEALLQEEQQRLLQQEKDCLSSIKDAEREASEELATRLNEEKRISEVRNTLPTEPQPASKQTPTSFDTLEKTIYDIAREKLKEGIQKKQDDEQKGDGDVGSVDFLSPFLAQYGTRKLNKNEATAAKEACLHALRERLIDRFQIIQKRLEEEQQNLAKKQAAFQRRGDNVDRAEEEEYEKYVSEALFRIQILEKRLARHEETSLVKFAEMDAKLRADPRLNSWKTEGK